MKKFSFMTLIAFFSLQAYAQQLSQTVRGTLFDAGGKSPLIGAAITILGSDPLIGTITDVEGKFRLEKVPTGRFSLHLSYIGYESKVIPNILVNSGKEVVLELNLQESIVKMDEIVIKATKNKGEALNDMAMISARSISPEETNRYPGSFNDPSRIVANFAGVTNTQDGSNDIIVRGNSPKYVQWRLEGVQITNPNHFSDQNTASGAISTLNNNLLATSDFYTSAFSAEYGDALSAVYDLKLRAGNNEKVEAVFGFGLLGTDFTVEGPFKKGYGGSYVVNYRYSTASIISGLGLVDISGIPKFQDASFKIVLPTTKMGTFSMFGLGGKSSFLFEDVTPEVWETPGDRAMNALISEDYKKGSHLLNLGLNHSFSINKHSFINTTLSYSNEGIADDIFENTVVPIYNGQGDYLRDSVVSTTQNFNGELMKTTYRGALTYNNKINAKNKIQTGTKYALFDFDYHQSQFSDDTDDRFTAIDFKENLTTIRNFISWRHRLNEDITVVAGVHNMNVLLNNKHTLEPRLAINWKLNSTSSVHAGYGLHSTMESIHHYFAKVEQADGTVIEPNRDLDLLKAHHYVLGYEKRFGDNMRLILEVYYQNLFNLPVENSDTSYFATINEGVEFRYVDLVNEGTGENYGIEITLERFYSNNFYYMINGSLYESKYKSLENIERNTHFSSNYLINILAGKEFEHWGKKQNQTLALNAKIFFGGGRKIIPLLRDSEGNLAVDPDSNKYWDYNKAYDDKLEDVYMVTLSASYKWNRPKATHELVMNLDNVTDNKGKLSEFYDESEPNSIGYLTQFGFFPNLQYRVYF